MPLSKINLAKYKADVFIETGTHRGRGVQQALKAGFDRVYTVECDIRWSSRMSPSVNDERVTLVYGDSAKILPVFLGECEGKSVTFWLDAHHGGDLFLNETPLLGELEAIAESIGSLGDVTIMIDDMRLYPQEEQMMLELLVGRMRQSVDVSYEPGVEANDIMVGRM